MSYTAFARKYRPRSFDDIAGQSHVTITLKNAIKEGRTAHAYLFSGPRGVGKTTTARILARALNCENGPTPNPCGSCASCKEISASSSIDVLEIDGASNRGIDEIRNLRENAKFSPSKSRFRIYIIDEVHMLTDAAFNALLKTLEEPPPHVKFIFATTQAYKLPSTILSRCQRFDFRRLSVKDIFESLKDIAAKEGLKISDDALNLIARRAAGSMRDAQVTLDQMASFTAASINVDDVSNMLGVVEDDVLFGLSGAIASKDALSALKIIDKFVNEGKDVFQAVLGMIEHFRNLLVAKISDDPASLIETGPERIKVYKKECENFTIEELLYAVYTLSNTIDFIRKTSLSRSPLEAAVIKLSRAGSIVPLADILDNINRIGRPQRGPAVSPAAASSSIATAHVSKPQEAPRKTPQDLDEISSAWTGVVDFIRPKKISIASYLQEGYPVSLEGRVLTVGFPKECQFHKDVLETVDNRRLIEEAVKNVLKMDLKVVLTLVEPVRIKQNGLNGCKTEGSDPEIDPIIKSAMEVFGGDIAGEAE
jgi:DNA polymerase-3 subunit gamma/tau